MTISLIIPAHNEEKYLGDCLRSVIAHKSNDLLEIIVVDNASTDRTAKLAEQFPGVRVVREPTKGLTHARARGLAEARGELFASLDADTRIDARWFPLIRKHFTEDPHLIALSGPYGFYDLPRWQRRLVHWYWKFLGVPAAKILGYVIVGGNFVARKDALQKIGGFDTSIAFYGEDTNIARRLHNIGKIRFDMRFSVLSSGRRLVKEGMFKIGLRYVGNFLSEVFRKKPMTSEYVDIR